MFISFMRTVVPLVAGALLGWAARVGLDLDESAVAGVVGYVEVVAAGVYYAVFRVVESWAGRMRWEPLESLAGVLLGWARPPHYRPVPEEVVSIRLRLDTEHLAGQLQEATARVGAAAEGAVIKP